MLNDLLERTKLHLNQMSPHVSQRLTAQLLAEVLAYAKALEAKPPSILFDGYEVLQAMDKKAKARTSPDDGQSRSTVGLGADVADFLRNQKNLAAEKDAEIKQLRAALKLYVDAGFGESTDFHKQDTAYDAAVEALK